MTSIKRLKKWFALISPMPFGIGKKYVVELSHGKDFNEKQILTKAKLVQMNQ